MDLINWKQNHQSLVSNGYFDKLASRLLGLKNPAASLLDLILICNELIESIQTIRRVWSILRRSYIRLPNMILAKVRAWLATRDCLLLRRVCKAWNRVLTFSKLPESRLLVRTSEKHTRYFQIISRVELVSLLSKDDTRVEYLLCEGKVSYHVVYPQTGTIMNVLPKRPNTSFLCNNHHLLVELVHGSHLNIREIWINKSPHILPLSSLCKDKIGSSQRVANSLCITAQDELIFATRSTLTRWSLHGRLLSQDKFSDYSRLWTNCTHKIPVWRRIHLVRSHSLHSHLVLLSVGCFLVILNTRAKEMVKCSCSWPYQPYHPRMWQSFKVAVGRDVTAVYKGSQGYVVPTSNLFEPGEQVHLTQIYAKEEIQTVNQLVCGSKRAILQCGNWFLEFPIQFV